MKENENPFVKGGDAYWAWRSAGFPDELLYFEVNPYLKDTKEYEQFIKGYECNHCHRELESKIRRDL